MFRVVLTHFAQGAVPEEDWSLDMGGLADKVLNYPSKVEPPYNIFPDQWAHDHEGLLEETSLTEATSPS